MSNTAREGAALHEAALDPIDFVALAENLPQLAWMADAQGWIYW